MRGTLRWEARLETIEGIIPADAGNTSDCCSTGRNRAGSSPRMRGTHVDAGGRQQGHRIIPADAGNTGSCVGPSRMGGDHPRGCGEHKCSRASVSVPSGSSPRMRRTLQRDRHLLQMCGIIPADAGNTCSAWSKICFCWDHPRGCGEHGPLTGR